MVRFWCEREQQTRGRNRRRRVRGDALRVARLSKHKHNHRPGGRPYVPSSASAPIIAQQPPADPYMVVQFYYNLSYCVGAARKDKHAGTYVCVCVCVCGGFGNGGVQFCGSTRVFFLKRTTAVWGWGRGGSAAPTWRLAGPSARPFVFVCVCVCVCVWCGTGWDGGGISTRRSRGMWWYAVVCCIMLPVCVWMCVCVSVMWREGYAV